MIILYHSVYPPICTPLTLVVDALDIFDAALFTGLILLNVFGNFFVPDQKLDIIHPLIF